MLKLYNSHTKKEEEFTPLNPPVVTLYTCGPTVYDYPSIGNWRTYTTSDILLRTLQAFGFEVKFVMNITDVGHLTGDNLGDADTGEDRLEKAAKKERKTAWDIASFYTEHFLEGFEKLNLTKPLKFTKATEYIEEQIALVQTIEKNGFAYKISDGIYFDVAAYEKKGNEYGQLSDMDKIKEGARVEKNPEKKDPRDFALWKFSPADQKRDMEWESPWGKGFPGWHVECSAMSMKYLGNQLDLHTGGEDLKAIHHPNEIAQSEAATGKKPFVRYWIHGAFLQVDGGRMGKSLGNAYNLDDIEKKEFDPMDLRYFYLTAHYRTLLNFTWEALDAARSARKNLVNIISQIHTEGESKRTTLSSEKLEKVKQLQQKFTEALSNDLNMPQALSVVWEAVKSNIPSEDKYDLITSFDQVLGLHLSDINIQVSDKVVVSEEIQKLVGKRNQLRAEQKWDEADKVRKEIEEKGWKVEDSSKGSMITKK